jgi:hypothetical protein
MVGVPLASVDRRGRSGDECYKCNASTPIQVCLGGFLPYLSSRFGIRNPREWTHLRFTDGL